MERGGTAREKLWCVGHSLGSHICGHAGQTFKLGRITGNLLIPIYSGDTIIKSESSILCYVNANGFRKGKPCSSGK